MLKRFAAVFPDKRFDDELSVSEQMQLQERDPMLLQIISGAAPASLELQVLDGSFADTAPDQQAIQAAAANAEVEQLIAEGAFPTQGYYQEDGSFVPPTPGNLTAQLRIAALDQQRYEQEKLKAIPPKQTGLSEQDAAWVNAEAARIASLNMIGGQ